MLRVRSFILQENLWTPRISVKAFVYAPLIKVVDSTFQFASSSFSGIHWILLFLVEANERTLVFTVIPCIQVHGLVSGCKRTPPPPHTHTYTGKRMGL